MASNAIKRQRKRRRIDADGDPEFQVAPMVDVLLVLLLFFMSITSTELLKKVKNVQLPDAKNGGPSDKKNQEIVVNIAWDPFKKEPQFSLDAKTYPDAASMTGDIAAQQKSRPQAYVLIRADRDVPYSNVADLMTACAGAGVGTVTFAVITGGGDQKSAPAGASK